LHNLIIVIYVGFAAPRREPEFDEKVSMMMGMGFDEVSSILLLSV